MAKKITQHTLFNIEQPVAQCKLPKEWFNIFEGLSDDELRLLFILTFVGDEYSFCEWTASKIKGIHTISARTAILRKLVDLGLVEEDKSYRWQLHFEIANSKLFAVMLYALDCRPDLLSQVKPKIHAKSESNSLWEIVQAYYDGATNLQTFHEAKAHEYYELYKMLDDFIGTDFLEIMCTAMPTDDFFNLMSIMFVRTYQFNVENHLAIIDYCWHLHKVYWENDRSNLSCHIHHDFIIMYEFIFTGSCIHTMSQVPNKFQHMINAVLKLYQSKYKESLALFGEALKAFNHSLPTKNVIPNQIMCFYLLLCYAKLEDKKKAQAFANKSDVQKFEIFIPALLVALKLILNESCEEIDDYIRIMFRKENIPSSRLFAMLFARFFTDHNISIPQDIQGTVPQCALLRYEMSATGMPCADREQLRQALGGEPILASIRVKQKWETLLENLHALQAETTAKPVEQKKNERLVYVVTDHIYYGRSIELHRQKSLKAGGWGKPFAISHSTFLNKNVSFAEPVDYDIIKTLLANKSNQLFESFPCEHVLPHLIGSDKVFFFDPKRKEYSPVQVIEQKPYIQLDKSKNGYIVISNVPIPEKYVLGKSAVSWQGDTQAIVYRLSEFERHAIQLLCKQGRFPLEAENSLKSFIHAAGNQLEVHSELIEGGSLLEKKSASSVIVLRLEPTTEGCALQVHVSPLENGKLRLFPGRGMAVVYDDVDGKRCQIDRDLSLEKKRLDMLQAYLIDIAGATVDHNDSLLLELESVLSLLQFVGEHSEEFKVEWPEDRRYKLKNIVTKDFEAIQVVSKESWFEVEGELKIGEKEAVTAAEMLRLLQQGRVGKRFVRLSDDEFIALSDSLAKQLQKLEKIAQVDSKKAIITRLQVGELAKIVQTSNNTIKSNEHVTELAEKIQQAANMSVPQPKGLQAQLRDYQLLGYEWMSRLAAWGAGGCLADDMGLGKTVQAIAFLLQRAKEGASMVIAPASVVFNWQNELQRFAPTLRVHILNEAEDRKKLIKSLKANDILLTTYGLLVREEEILTKRKWNVVCLDEAHTIKNRSTKMSQVAMDLLSQTRLLLTGTPVQNHLGELWNLFQFLNPGLLGSYEWFNRRYIQPIEQGSDERRSQLRKLVQPFILRRTKSEVVEELPDKIEMTRKVELSSTEYAAYEAVRVEAQNSLNKENKVSVSVLSEITRLREAACSLSLINKAWAEGSSKLDDMSTLVSQIVEGGNRVLIFSQFTSFLTQAKGIIDALGIESFYLDGSTPLAKRKKMVEQFQQGEKSVFFISLKAGGLGLNLTGANYVIHLDPWWNPAIEQQATDRAYRIGQDQKVTVYHLIAKNTIEEKILRLHQTKRDIADSILEGTNSSHALNLDDLRYLLEVE